MSNHWRLTDSKSNPEVRKDQTIDAGGKRNLRNRNTDVVSLQLCPAVFFWFRLGKISISSALRSPPAGTYANDANAHQHDSYQSTEPSGEKMGVSPEQSPASIHPSIHQSPGTKPIKNIKH